MENASPAVFRPTWRQAVSRGVLAGILVASVGVIVALAVVAVVEEWTAPPVSLWVLMAFGPPVAGALLAAAARRRTGVQVSAGGIRVSAWSGEDLAWDRVVDMRAERRGARTVVSVYLDSGASMQLRAPYSGEFFAADPRFEGKMFILSYMWRSHRFGGLPG